MPVRFASVLLLAATAARASVKPATHSHTDAGHLPSRWYHEEGHPVYSLFRRAGSNDGVAYAAIGTPGMPCAEFLCPVLTLQPDRMVCGLSCRPRLDDEYASVVARCVEPGCRGWQDTRHTHVYERWYREPNVSHRL